MASKVTKKRKHRDGDAKASHNAVEDPRFASIGTDPRFRLPSRKNAQFKIDKRFAHMLSDEEFSRKARVDRYGRSLGADAGKRELQRFYHIDEGDDEASDGDEKQQSKKLKTGDSKRRQQAPLKNDKASLSRKSRQEDVDTRPIDNDAAVIAELARVEERYDPAREGGFSSSESDSEDDEDGSDEERLDDTQVLSNEGGRDSREPIPLGDATRRIAAVNLDWDNIRAIDLMAVAQSLANDKFDVKEVKILPSEYGKERLKREDTEGPASELFSKRSDVPDDLQAESDDGDDLDVENEKIRQDLIQEDTGEEYSSADLRTYQLSRLKYYYAVITCASAASAKSLYDNMDGSEYLSTSNFFDLRFVPDDMTFDDEPRDICTKVPSEYTPNEFVTDALTHSKVRLTWDADDSTRKAAQKRAFSRAEIEEDDLKAYIGNESSDEDEGEPLPRDEKAMPSNGESTMSSKAAAERERMRAALGLASEPAKRTKRKGREAEVVGDLQVTFTPFSETAPSAKNMKDETKDETTREKYLRMEQERKTKRKGKTRASKKEVDGNSDNDEPSNAADLDITFSDEGGFASSDEDLAEPRAKDDPFDDPFFKDASADTAAAVRKHKEESKKDRRAREEANEVERAELELLMNDDTITGVRHFDMKEIEKKEKRRKKKSKGHKAHDAASANDADDQFHMQVQDPRFASLYQSHEFAIDPTNPRYKATEGMKALLEEGRRKRRVTEQDDDAPRTSKKKMGKASKGTSDRSEIDKLVRKLKDR